jgi:light-harvesting complex I chlorophyll a/b binding protein 4
MPGDFGFVPSRTANYTYSRSVCTQAREAAWRPGSTAPPHLDGSLPADYGFDPLNLGSNPDKLKWFREAELLHARWAMLGTAGVLAQEIVRPDVFFYDAPLEIDLPINAAGLVVVQILLMHYTEIRRYYAWRDGGKGKMLEDPIFKGNTLPEGEPGYPGGIFAPFVPGDLNELKVKELKNGRLAMLSFIGFIMSAQVTGKNPIANLIDHVAAPMTTNMFSKAAVIPGASAGPACSIEPTHVFQGIEIPTPCFIPNFWP